MRPPLRNPAGALGGGLWAAASCGPFREGLLPLVSGGGLCGNSGWEASEACRSVHVAASGRCTGSGGRAGAPTSSATGLHPSRLLGCQNGRLTLVLPSRGLGAGCSAGAVASSGAELRPAGVPPVNASPDLSVIAMGALAGTVAREALCSLRQHRGGEEQQGACMHGRGSDAKRAVDAESSLSSSEVTRRRERTAPSRTETTETSNSSSKPGLWYPQRQPGMLPEHVTFHKRALPAPAVPFSSPTGKALFLDALIAGTAECYFPLSEQFITQAEPAYCGITSLAMVLNTLGIDPRRTWKGRWRWYVEDMLDCCTPLSEVQKNGITFRQMACLAQCNGADAQVRSHEGISLQEFRDLAMSLCRQAEQFLIVSYSRATFSQSGDGHFSPIGAYHEATDQVLIMDVARFKYPPHWVPVEQLYSAMSRIDRETGLPRGLMVLSRQKLTDSVLFMLEAEDGAWRAGYDFVRAELPVLVAQHISQAKRAHLAMGSCTMAFNLPKVLASLAAQLPPKVADSLKLRRPPGCSLGAPHTGCSKHEASIQLLRELHAMPLCQAIKELLPGDTDLLAERLLMMLMLAPKEAWGEVPSQYRAGILDMLNPSSGRWAMNVVATELEVLQTQMRELQDMDEIGALG